MEKKFYVYVHRRLSDGTIFYVGKGSGRRLNETYGRSKHWQNVSKKNGWSAHIVSRFSQEQCAFSFEISLISYIGKKNLVNVTDGGDGVAGLIHDEASKKKMRGPRPDAKAWLKGRSAPDYLKEKWRKAKIGKKQSPEHAEKSRNNKFGVKIKDTSKFNLEKRKPVKNSNGEFFESAAEAAREMSIRLGVNASQGNITMAVLGRRKTAYGMEWSHAPK